MAPPPPFKMQTRGRANIKAPQKYEGLIEHNDSEEELYRPPTGPRRSSVYRGKVVDFNPDLPPAAFPTLELGQRRAEIAPVVEDETMHNALVDQTNRNLPCEMHRPARSTHNTSTSDTNNSRNTRFENLFTQNQPGGTDSQKSRKVHQLTDDMGVSAFPRSVSSTPHDVYQVERRWSNQGDTRLNVTNTPYNPAYAHTLETMMHLDAREQRELIMAEMETSDEEDTSRGPVAEHGTFKHRSHESLNKLWEELPVALKVNLVDIMTDIFPATEAMQRLHLNSSQRQEMLDLVDKRNAQIAAEDDAAEALREETMQILLSRSGEELKLVTQTGFRNMLEEDLYITRGGNDYYTATRTEVSKAQKYLKRCGQKPELLDHWKSALGSVPGDGKDVNGQDASVQQASNRSQALSEVLLSSNANPPKAAFPTKSCFSVQPIPQAAVLENSVPNPLSETQYTGTSPRLPVAFTSLNPSAPAFNQHKAPPVLKASDIQTPLPTPSIPEPRAVSDQILSAQNSTTSITASTSGSDEEPPPKKRQVSATDRRKSALAAPDSIYPTNQNKTEHVSILKATTKSNKGESTNAASAAASALNKRFPHALAESTNPSANSPAPKPSATPTAMQKSMPAPPKPVPTSAGKSNGPHNQSTIPTQSASNPIPISQPPGPKRRKATTTKPATSTSAEKPPVSQIPTPALKPSPKKSTSTTRKRATTRKATSTGKDAWQFEAVTGGAVERGWKGRSVREG